MPGCVFKKCTNHNRNASKENGITFHAFPKNELRRHDWISVVRRQRQEMDWTPSIYSRVCSVHFLLDHIYTTTKGLKRISLEAIPVFEDVEYCSGRYSPNSLCNVPISPSIFDSPRKTYLKTKIKKLTSDKKKILMENKNMKQKLKRFEVNRHSLKNMILNFKKKIALPEDHFREVLLKAESADLYARMSRYSKGSRVKFSPRLRKFALTLHYYSPAAYKYIRKCFNNSLPHWRTLGKWYENTDAMPGFTAEAFNILKKKHEQRQKRILCTLVVDEMAIRRQTLWSGTKTLGLVNFGAGTIDQVASQVFVMMLVCMNENWKLPIGYFFVDGLTAESRANLIKTALSKSWDVGVDIVALTFDGCPSNKNAANLLGCKLNDIKNLKTTFKHPSCDKNVAVFLDPCHMLKLVRNTFEGKKLIYDGSGREIRWQFLVRLLKLQESETLNFANKLTPRHIEFRNQIMKVKLATQLLSKSVATALRLCNQLLTSSHFIDTDGTVEFIERFNDVFDVMNSRKRERFGFKRPICRENKDFFFKFLDEMKNYISSLKILNKTRRSCRGRITMTITKKNIIDTQSHMGFMGFIICIDSLKYLYSTLVETNVLEYIATYRLSQDHLELLFGIIRRHGGNNNNPNARQFQGIYRKLLGHMELRSSFSGNCIPLDNFPILNCSSAVENINKSNFRYHDTEPRSEIDNSYFDMSNVGCHEKRKSTQIGDYKIIKKIKQKLNVVRASDANISNNVEIMNNILNESQRDVTPSAQLIIGYISGFVSRALIKTIKCETCVVELITNERLYFHKLITLKDMGGLCYPSIDVFNICVKSEIAIKMFIRENQTQHFLHEIQSLRLRSRILKSFLNSNVLSKLNLHSFDQPATFNHRIQLLKAIIDKYCNVRVHYFHKIDPAVSIVTKRQKRNKLSLFEGT